MQLEQLLQYQNPNILQRYAADFPHNQLSGPQALQELVKFFWLAEKHRREHRAEPANKALHFQCTIHPEMQEIDDMWHTFLLFTRDYSSFCRSYFGRFIHHVPNVEEKPVPKAQFKREFARFASYVYDHLGEETLIAWFEQNTEKHSNN